jgi:hypothetical protein
MPKKVKVIKYEDSKGKIHHSKEAYNKAEASYKKAKKDKKKPLPKPPFKKSGVKDNMKKVGKAQPQPPNVNSGQTRCYIRYNNQGRPYRICDDGKPKAGFPKPPSQITPLITPQEFLEERGKAYHELTDGQVREYHRLDMANRRLTEKEIKSDEGEERLVKWREEKKKERQDWRNTRVAELEKIKKNKSAIKKKLRDEIKEELAKEYKENINKKIKAKEQDQQATKGLELMKLMSDLKEVNDYLDNNPETHHQYDKNQAKQIQLQSQISALKKDMKGDKVEAKKTNKIINVSFE